MDKNGKHIETAKQGTAAYFGPPFAALGGRPTGSGRRRRATAEIRPACGHRSTDAAHNNTLPPQMDAVKGIRSNGSGSD